MRCVIFHNLDIWVRLWYLKKYDLFPQGRKKRQDRKKGREQKMEYFSCSFVQLKAKQINDFFFKGHFISNFFTGITYHF